MIFRGTCSHCGHETGLRATDWRAVITDSGSLTILGHPLETYFLAKLGLTSSEAVRQGRLVSCCLYVCPDCGGFYERREILRPGPGDKGCVLGLLFGMFIAMITATLSDSLALSLIAFFEVFITLNHAIVRVAAVWNWGRRTEGSGFAVEDAPCRCNQLDFDLMIPLDRAVGRDPPFKCSSCDRESLVFRFLGIS